MSYGAGPGYRALTAKCFEPQRRNKDGMRWISHRFEIKGGISLREVMLLDMRRNVLIAERDVDGVPTPTFRGIRILLDA